MPYTKKEFIQALRDCGVNLGDIIMIHVGMSAFKELPQGIKNQDELSAFTLECLKESIGENGTLIVPAFTYSLGNGYIFDAKNTPCPLVGPFCEYFRKQDKVFRSDDPFLSVCAIGKHAKELTQNISNTSYGNGSFFQNFTNIGGKIVCIGVGLRWATIRHYYEEMAKVPFRHKKRFDGKIIKNGKIRKCTWFYSVSPRCDNAYPLGAKLEEKITDAGLFKKAKLAKAFIGCIKSKDYMEFALKEFERDPWISAKGPSCDLVAAERKRTLEEKFDIHLKNTSIKELINKLKNIPRYPLGDGFRAAINALNSKFKFKIYKYPTGSEAFDYLVPPRWICKDAFISDTNNIKLFELKNNAFGVLANSKQICTKISKEKLLSHIKVVKEQNLSKTSIIKNRKHKWGFCLLPSQYRAICKSQEKEFNVYINNDFSYDWLKIAEYSTNHKFDKIVLLCADFSGEFNSAIAGLKAIQELQKNDLTYTYKLVLLPSFDSLNLYLFNMPNIYGIILLSSKKPKQKKTIVNFYNQTLNKNLIIMHLNIAKKINIKNIIKSIKRIKTLILAFENKKILNMKNIYFDQNHKIPSFGKDKINAIFK